MKGLVGLWKGVSNLMKVLLFTCLTCPVGSLHQDYVFAAFGRLIYPKASDEHLLVHFNNHISKGLTDNQGSLEIGNFV